MLLSTDVAADFFRLNSWREWNRASELVNHIDRWMASKGLAASSISRIDVAREVVRLQSRPAPLPAPEEAAWQTQQQEGTTATPQNDLQLAAQINAMSPEEFAQYRQVVGLL